MTDQQLINRIHEAMCAVDKMFAQLQETSNRYSDLHRTRMEHLELIEKVAEETDK